MRLLLEDHQVELIYHKNISHENLLNKVKAGKSRVPRVWKLLVDKLPYDIFGGEMGVGQNFELHIGDGVSEPHFFIKTRNMERTVFYVINLLDPSGGEEAAMVEALRTARKLNRFYDRYEAKFEDDSAGFAVVISKKKALF
jgi:hypothetical protein